MNREELEEYMMASKLKEFMKDEGLMKEVIQDWLTYHDKDTVADDAAEIIVGLFTKDPDATAWVNRIIDEAVEDAVTSEIDALNDNEADAERDRMG